MKNIPMKHKAAQGFTLIELMIVVAIIGVLASVALPAYQNYIIRAEASEVVLAASAGRTAISEFYAARGAFPSNATEAGVETTASGNVDSITVANGVITVVGSKASVGADITVVLTPSTVSNSRILNWTCGAQEGTQYLPASCRAAVAAAAP